jgi:hypothetical protein
MPDAKLTAAREWIASALPDLSDVLILRQPLATAPIPAGDNFPFAGIGWLADVPLSATPYEVTTSEFAGEGPDPGPGPGNENAFWQRRYQRRRRTLQVRLYGNRDAAEDIWDYASLLRQTLRRFDVLQLLKAAGLSIIALGEPTDASEIRGTNWVSIVMLDFGILYVQTDSNTIPVIETVSTISFSDGPVDE